MAGKKRNPSEGDDVKPASTKKQKAETSSTADKKDKKPAARSAPRPWTDEEELALVQACYDILKPNVPTIAAHPALHSRETSKVGMKLNQTFAHVLKRGSFK